MSWYRISKQCFSLHKRQMRVDLRTYCDDSSVSTNPNELQSKIKSILTTAIMKGLDVIGIVSNSGPQVGWESLKLVKTQNMDIFVVPGEDYQCVDKTQLYIYLLQQPMPPGLKSEQAIQYAKSHGGFIMVGSITRRQAQWLDRVKGQANSPQAVELYADDYSGYSDSHLSADYQCFINSGARSPSDLESSTSFTMIDREVLEGLGLLPEDEGKEYTPNYLRNSESAQLPQQPVNPQI